MELLRNLFGNLTSGIIRLLVGVGILAAVYFFIVKPVLHTTDNAINSANKTFESRSGPKSTSATSTRRSKTSTTGSSAKSRSHSATPSSTGTRTS